MEIRPIDANALHALYAGPFVQTYAECRKALDDAPTLSLNTLRDAVYEDAVAHGLWKWAESEHPDIRSSLRKRCALDIGAEVLELHDECDNKDGFVEELADVIIMSLSVAGKLGIDIDAAIRRKMEINRGRPWKHGKSNE